MIKIGRSIVLDDRELKFFFIRSSGPGGQNVNKVSTAVQLRFHAAASKNLPEEVRHRLIRLAGKKMTRSGTLVITAGRFRSQDMNRADAVERLTRLIRKACETPKPRKKSKPTAASVERRLEAKKRRSGIKRFRKSRGEDDV
ncbi:aminoacyl-tRNA hydrolase [bacterium]|nr:aminoacyl-tRNA hydrolase [bacterium]